MVGGKDYVISRMKELYLYDLYWYRREIKTLASILYYAEPVNCFLTGVSDGLRRFLAVTDSRAIIIGQRFGSPEEIDIIPRKDISSYSADKKLFGSSVRFSAENGAEYSFTGVSRRVLDLFIWSMKQDIPVFDE